MHHTHDGEGEEKAMSRFTMRQLGKTGLVVSPIGIGGGGGIGDSDLLYAFEHGINYFFFSSDLHHYYYQRSAAAIRTLCGMGSSVRDKVVLATVSYLKDIDKLFTVIYDQFDELGLDYIDVFHWGWIADDDDLDTLLRGALQLKEDGSVAHAFRKYQVMYEQTCEINEEILKRGLARYVGASFHSRQAAIAWMGVLDVLMLRYNAAHRGAERELFPLLSGDKSQDPGIVVFNTAHEGTRFFHIPPLAWPAGEYVPSIPDCYRFALSNPWVDVVLTGVANRKQVDLALIAMEQGLMSGEEQAVLRRYTLALRRNAPV